MKNDNWLIYIVVAFTSLTTFGLVSDGTLFGVVRGAMAAVILDGLVIYWEGKRITNKDEKQRRYSGYMMWAGVGILLLFAGGWAVEYTLPSDVVRTITVLNYSVSVGLSELILYIASTIIGVWVVLTLAVVLYLRGIDPETQKDIERTKAAEEREKEELKAYKIANKYTAHELGTIKAMELYRRDLQAIGKYTAGEIERMVLDAEQEIARQQIVPGVLPESVGLHVNQATVDAPKASPSTLPSDKK